MGEKASSDEKCGMQGKKETEDYGKNSVTEKRQRCTCFYYYYYCYFFSYLNVNVILKNVSSNSSILSQSFSTFSPPFRIAFCWLLDDVDQVNKQIKEGT